MTIRHFNTILKSAGTQIDLAATDDAVIGKSGLIENTDNTGSAITASGSHQQLSVNGAVKGGDETILLGDNAWADHGDHLDVSASGSVVSATGIAVVMNSFGGTIRNDGKIFGGGVAIECVSAHETSTMTVINSGRITSADSYGILFDGSESYVLENTGIILGASNAVFGEYAEHAITIHNTGKMFGGIDLSGNDDIYDGHNGIATGTISGEGGDDSLTGGGRDETLEGGLGHDILAGGAGADVFLFQQTLESTVTGSGRDLVTDFSHAEQDKIDLSAIDANTSTAGMNDSFSFIGNHPFGGQAGELRCAFANGHTLIYGDVDGDKQADFEIELGTHTALVKGDFLL
jgi:Ca2+-binding RTX toxin-like protein